MNERMARVALAVILLAAVFAGSLVLMNTPWMPVVYPTRSLNPKVSSRVAIEQTTIVGGLVVVSSCQYDPNIGTWSAPPFPLHKGETVTVEFEVTPTPSPPPHALGVSGVSLGVFRFITGYSSIFYSTYTSDGVSSPNVFIVPETGDYQVRLQNWETQFETVHLKLTVQSTTIGSEQDTAPYGKTQTLMMVWLLLGAGMIIGALCADLVRPKQRLVSSQSLPPPLRVGHCPNCGTMNPPTSKFCNECAAALK
jgi:hypothetical protein